MDESPRYTLNGRTFVPVGESTIGHDVWLIGQIRAAGLDEVLMRAGESTQGFAARLLHEVCAKGSIFTLLGGLIIPEGTPGTEWCESIATQTAQHLATVSDPREKALVQSLIIEALVDFFGVGLSSFLTSQTSSSDAEPTSVIVASPSTATGEG